MMVFACAERPVEYTGRREKYMRKKFLYRMCLLLMSIMAMGFLAFSAVTVHYYAKNTTTLRCDYERELIEKRASEFNNRLVQIGNVFSKAYLPNSDRTSVAEEMMKKTWDTDEMVLENYLQDLIGNSDCICEALLIDTRTNQIYENYKPSYRMTAAQFNWKDDPFVQRVRKSNGIQISALHPVVLGNQEQMVYTFGHSIQNMRVPGGAEEYGIILVNVLKNDFSPNRYLRDTSSPGHYVILDKNDEVFWGDSTPEENQKTADRFLEQKDRQDRYDMASFRLVSWSGLTCIFVTDLNQIFSDSLKTVLQIVLPFLLAVLVICGLASLWGTASFDLRIKRIIQHVRGIEKGNLDAQMTVSGEDELADIEKALNTMSRHLQRYIEKEYVADLTLKKAQIRSLQMQINPHFMFNTLESIRSCAMVEGNSHTAQMITILGQMYRWNLRSQDQVKLRDELDYLDYYVRLREMNIQTELELEVEIPRKCEEVWLPKLSVQPIVENSLAHGYDSLDDGVLIKISAREEDNKMILCVEDNGRGMESEQMQLLQEKIDSTEEADNLYHIGLMNVNQRVRLLYGKEYGMHLKAAQEHGLLVELTLPMGGTEHD